MFHLKLFTYFTMAIVAAVLLKSIKDRPIHKGQKLLFAYFCSLLFINTCHQYIIRFAADYTHLTLAIYSILTLAGLIVFPLTTYNRSLKSWHIFVCIGIFTVATIGYFLLQIHQIKATVLLAFLFSIIASYRKNPKQFYFFLCVLPFFIHDITRIQGLGGIFLFNIELHPFITLAYGLLIYKTSHIKLENQWNLSPREYEVFIELSKGLNNKEISEKLFISQSTVKKHIHSIYKKSTATSRWQLLQWSNLQQN